MHLRATPDSAATAQATRFSRQAQAPEQLCFWSPNGVDRYALLKSILNSFAQQNVHTTLDSGWDNHDVEIVGSRWALSSLTTASEYLSERRIFLRCRLKAKWSAPATILFALLFGIELLLISHFVEVQPWVWVILLTLPLLAWFFEEECRDSRLLTASLVSQAAAQLGLQRYDGSDAAVTVREQDDKV